MILVISPSLLGKNSDFSSQVNGLLSSLFNDLEVKDFNAYIAEIREDRLYLNKGLKADLAIGDRLLVVHTIDLLKDPVTQKSLGRITEPMAEISITAVEKNYAVAKIEERLSRGEIEVGDRVINDKDDLKILLAQFKSSQELKELAANIEAKFYSYLTRNKLFKLSAVNISNYSELKSSEEEGDYLVTGEVYEGEDKLYLKVELSDLDTGLTAAEQVISFKEQNEIVDYYRQKYISKQTGYKFLFKTDEFAGVSYNLAWGALEEGSIVINQGSSLKVMDYDNKLKLRDTIEEYNRTQYDDYNLVLGDIDGAEGLEIFAENYNYPVQIKKSKQEYKANFLKEFYRNRPKLIAKIEEQNYLLTRDYKNVLRFNLWEQNKLVTKFKIEIEKNEGYRVEISDLDRDKEQELIMTSYQEEQGYRLRVYDLDYKLKTELNKILGAEFVTANLNNNQTPEIYGYSKEDNKIFAFEYQNDDYEEIWQSKELAQDIVDLTVGDINQDGKKELLVLVTNDEQSRIYVYHYKSAEMLMTTNTAN